MLSPMQLPSAFKLFSSDFLLYPWAHYFLFLIGVGESTEAEVVASEALLLIWEDTMSHTGTDFRFIFPSEALETSHYSYQSLYS